MTSEQRARQVLRAAGLPEDTPLERASSDANEVWLGEDFALRVNVRGERGRLAREARVAARLPSEVRYPRLRAQGTVETEEGPLEWMVVERVQGEPLAHAWPRLSRMQRRESIAQLAVSLAALHAVPVQGLPTDEGMFPPHVLPLEALEDQLDLLQEVLDPGLSGALRERVRALWPAFDEEGRGLVHGDLHFGNMLWADDRVTALLDFEWARVSWLEVDLEIMRAFCADPAWFVPREDEPLAHPSDWEEVPSWFEEDYPAWFNHPAREQRLGVLAISRQLGHLVDFPVPPGDPSDPRDRHQILRMLAG